MESIVEFFLWKTPKTLNCTELLTSSSFAFASTKSFLTALRVLALAVKLVLAGRTLRAGALGIRQGLLALPCLLWLAWHPWASEADSELASDCSSWPMLCCFLPDLRRRGHGWLQDWYRTMTNKGRLSTVTAELAPTWVLTGAWPGLVSPEMTSGDISHQRGQRGSGWPPSPQMATTARADPAWARSQKPCLHLPLECRGPRFDPYPAAFPEAPPESWIRTGVIWTWTGIYINRRSQLNLLCHSDNF